MFSKSLSLEHLKKTEEMNEHLPAVSIM